MNKKLIISFRGTVYRIRSGGKIGSDSVLVSVRARLLRDKLSRRPGVYAVVKERPV